MSRGHMLPNDGLLPTDAELHAVPRGTVVRAADGTIACRFDQEYGVVFGDDRPFPWTALRAPAEILWQQSPEESAATELSGLIREQGLPE